MFAGWGNGARLFFETARCQRNIRGDAYVDSRDVLRDPVVGRVRAVADHDHSDVRGAWRPDRSRAVGDDENIELKTCRHAVDLLPHRARITIDVDVSQTLARCFSTTAIPAASTTAAAFGLP